MVSLGPPRLIPVALFLTAVLLVACGGDEAPAPTPVPTEPLAPLPTSIIPSLPPVQPLSLTPITPSFDYPTRPVIFDAAAGPLDPSTPAYAAALRATASWRITRLEETPTDTRLAVYDPLKDAWSAFDLGAATDRERIAPDGSRAAVQLRRDGPIVLVDLEAMTYRTLPLNALPRDFSPDTRRLVLGLPEDYSGAGPDSRWLVVDFDDPRRAWRLPAGKAGGPGEQSPPIWLSNTVLLSRTQNNTVLQLFDISGPVAKLTLEEPVPSDQIVLSSDHSTVGVQERIDKGSGRPGFDAYEYNVKVYSLSPFKLIATLPGAALGYQLDQPSRPPDDARFLAILDICVEDKSRLVAFNINDGTQDELARGKILQYVFSPDGRWVAFTTWPRNGYVIDADGSSPPRLVSDAISPFTPPAWSADSRYVSFNSFFGGGDYCI